MLVISIAQTLVGAQEIPMKKSEELAKKCKKFEKRVDSKTFIPGLPLLARLDGRAFHTFTKGLTRPFDERLITCMTETAKRLLEEFKADLVYTQSDEITLFWNTSEESKLFFGGKIFKLNSILSSTCSVIFYKELLKYIPEKNDKIPVFDCRTWQVPKLEDVIDVFVWRQLDATRNSLNSVAQSIFSHKMLQNKNKKEVNDMLREKGIIWDDLPMGLKRGYYYEKITVKEELDLTSRLDIPEKHRTKKMVIRNKIIEKNIPLLKENANNIEYFITVNKDIIE